MVTAVMCPFLSPRIDSQPISFCHLPRPLGPGRKRLSPPVRRVSPSSNTGRHSSILSLQGLSTAWYSPWDHKRGCRSACGTAPSFQRIYKRRSAPPARLGELGLAGESAGGQGHGWVGLLMHFTGVGGETRPGTRERSPDAVPVLSGTQQSTFSDRRMKSQFPPSLRPSTE
jgi:hypothetical protein